MMDRIKKIVKYSLVIIVLLFSFVLFLVGTTYGFFTLVKLSQLFVPGTITSQGIKGKLLHGFSIETINYQQNELNIKIHHLNVNWSLQKLLNPQIVLHDLKADKVDIWQSNSLQQIKKIQLNGLITTQIVTLSLLNLEYLDQNIQGTLDLVPKSPYSFNALLHLNPNNKDKKTFKGTFHFEGELQHIQYNGEFHGLGDFTLNGSLDFLNRLNLIGEWNNLVLTNANPTLISPKGNLKLTGALPQISMELNSQFKKDDESWQLITALDGALPWQWNIDINLMRIVEDSSQLNGLCTTISAKASIKDQRNGEALIKLQPGYYSSADSKLDFQGGTVRALLNEHSLHGEGAVLIDASKKLNLNFTLPKFDLSQGLASNQQLLLNLILQVDSLKFLEQISPEVQYSQGQLHASLKVKGPIVHPVVESTLTLTQLGIGLPRFGINLHPIDLSITSKEKKWQAQGFIASAGNKLIIKGQGVYPNGTIALTGTDILLVNSNEYQIKISPQLNLELSEAALAIKGSIVVPYAQIKPLIFSNSIAIPEDVVIKTKEQKDNLFNTSLDVRIEMGKEVELHAKGLNSTLTGAIHITQSPQGPINAAGELLLQQGYYKAYGQDLSIKRGRLFFTGGRIDNPGISLRASKKIKTSATALASSIQTFSQQDKLSSAALGGEIKVGVDVTGQLSQPNIRLFSNPSTLSQADILSMLVLGRPANQANKAGAQLLLTALSSMTTSSDTNSKKFIDQLKQKLGIDFDIKTDSQYNLATNQVSDSTGIVMGKSLSKRMYLSYNLGLSQSDPNILTLKYLLSKFLSVQLSSSTSASGVDVLYTSKSKQRPKTH
jgi:translocation and assembly module TamB